MSNKSFVIQYVIKAKDLYSKAAQSTKKSTDQMKSAMIAMRREFGNTASKISRGTRTISRSITKSKIAFHRAARSMQESMKKMEDSYGKTVSSIRNKAAVVSAVVTTTYLLMINSMKNASRDANETRSKFATVFKDIRSEAENTAKTLAASYGLARSEAKALLSNTGDLLTGFGFDQKQALEISDKVQKLAVDLASFTNYAGGAEGASMALTKALLGERESIKSLGISILEKDVTDKIRKMLAEGHTFSTLRQAKAQATLALAYEQSKNAIGDFSRTRDQLANQERIAQKSFQNMWEGFGEILEPLFLKIAQLKTRFYNFLDNLSPKMKKVILVFGAVVAALAPIVVLITTLMLTLPLIKLAFVTFAPVVVGALAPLLPIFAAIVAAAALIYFNWGKVSVFFRDFFAAFEIGSDGAFGKLIEVLERGAEAFNRLFGASEKAKKSVDDFSESGFAIGYALGWVFNTIIESLIFIGELLGQTLGAIMSGFDFSNFSIKAPDIELPEFMHNMAEAVTNAVIGGFVSAKDKIKNFFSFDFFGSKEEVLKKAAINQIAVQKASSNIVSANFAAKTSPMISANSTHKVDVNVGLEKGLRKTDPVKVTSNSGFERNLGGNLAP